MRGKLRLYCTVNQHIKLIYDYNKQWDANKNILDIHELGIKNEFMKTVVLN